MTNIKGSQYNEKKSKIVLSICFGLAIPCLSVVSAGASPTPRASFGVTRYNTYATGSTYDQYEQCGITLKIYYHDGQGTMYNKSDSSFASSIGEAAYIRVDSNYGWTVASAHGTHYVGNNTYYSND